MSAPSGCGHRSIWPIAVTIVGICTGTPRSASASFTLVQTFDDPTPTRSDRYGTSVAVDANRVLIGAIHDDTNGINVGQAQLFDAITGNLLRTFDDPTITIADRFGASVAVDGNHALIGAFHDDTNGTNVGQTHLFDVTTGSLLQTFNDPMATEFDLFGGSVAIDGDHVLIGAPGDDTHGYNVGQAHLFDAATGNLLRTFDDPTISNRDSFGHSVAIDGNHVLIGAPGDSSIRPDVGQAHLFGVTSGAVLQTFNAPTFTRFDSFGNSVAIDGNNVLIGAFRTETDGSEIGRAHLFDAVTGNLLQTFDDPTITTDDRFGNSVAIDGEHVLIGAFRDNTNGSAVGQAHLFHASTGNLLQTFDDPTITRLDSFGHSVAIDGDHVLIGANFDGTNGFFIGQAHLFAVVPAPAALPVGLLMLGLLGTRHRQEA